MKFSAQTMYAISTTVICAMLLLSAATYLFHQNTIQGVRALGFPDFFRLQLAVMKLLAAVALAVPQTPMRIKEWAYVGVGLFCITAFVAHVAHRDSILISIFLAVFFALLIASNVTLHKARASTAPASSDPRDPQASSDGGDIAGPIDRSRRAQSDPR